jgi:prepilin peptidase CpaA
MIMLVALLSLLIISAFIIDARRSIIPNYITVSGAVAGLALHIFSQGWSGFVFSFLGLLTGLFIMLLLYAFGALGAGDVKLFAAVGSITGFSFVINSMMYSILFAGVIGFVFLLVKKSMLRTGRRMMYGIVSLFAFKQLSVLSALKQGEHMKFPFMYAVAPGVVTAWLYANG